MANINILKKILQTNKNDDTLFFADNDFDIELLGQYICAISNMASINNREYGYILFGINSNTKEIIGTNINFDIQIDYTNLTTYISKMLTEDINFDISTIKINNNKIVIIEVDAAKNTPTKYDDMEYIIQNNYLDILSNFTNLENKFYEKSINKNTSFKKEIIKKTEKQTSIPKKTNKENINKKNKKQIKYIQQFDNISTNNLNKTMKYILNVVSKNPYIKVYQLQILTNLSEAGIKKNFKILKQNNILKRVGANKNGYWEIIRKDLL